MFNSCTNACNHFQRRYWGSPEVSEEGNCTVIFVPALKIKDKEWGAARSPRAPQTLLMFCAQGSLPRDYPGTDSWNNRNWDSFSATWATCFSYFPLIPHMTGSNPAKHLRGQDELCYFHSIIKAQPSISDPGPTLDSLTFVTWWLKLQQHGSVGQLEIWAGGKGCCLLIKWCVTGKADYSHAPKSVLASD